MKMKQLSLILFLLVPLLLLVCTASASAPKAVTTSGTLRGVREESISGTVAKFLGVRYAQPPTGGRRFLPPRALAASASSSEEVVADTYGAACMQPQHMVELMYPQLRGAGSSPSSEDCLFLNVFVPQQSSKKAELKRNKKGRAVMVWLPGEGYGFAKSDQFDGSELALTGDVVVVTVNYRVSVFGFLSTGDEGSVEGNAGLLDQLEALRWVRDNAAAFGGDPRRVTLFGRFTGAMSASALLVSPLSTVDGRPLFSRVILQSGIAGESWTVDKKPMAGVRNLARKVNCLSEESDDVPTTVDCLRRVPADHLLEVASRVHSWRLVLNNASLPSEPLQAVSRGKFLKGVPVILGTTAEEGSLCLLGHYAMKTKYLTKILDDDLEEGDFRELARSFLREYLQPEGTTEESRLLDEIVRRYRTDGNEGTLSPSWRDRYLRMCGDGYVRAKTVSMAKQLARHGASTYLYEFVHRPSFSIHPEFVKGAAHGDDVPFTLGIRHSSQQWTAEEVALSKNMMLVWSNFAKYGDPNPMSGTTEEWPSFSTSRKFYWEFSTGPSWKKVKKLSNEWRLTFWQKESDRLSKRKQQQQRSW